MSWPPAVEEVNELPVDALAIRLLKSLGNLKVNLRNLIVGLRNSNEIGQLRDAGVTGSVRVSGSTELPRGYELGISEAWHWLVANGLITEVPLEEGWFVKSRLGLGVEQTADPVSHMAAVRRIAVDLHPTIRNRVRSQFLLGEYDAAVFIAHRAVEERVRELGGYDKSDIGVSMAKKAFGAKGPLRDQSMDPGEADGLMALVWGAFGLFKNPASHRTVDYDDATEAAEVVLLADLLLRVLDRQAINLGC